MRKNFVGALLLLSLSSPALSAETYFSILTGPSFSLRQDIKMREFNSAGNRINMSVLNSETQFRWREGLSVIHYLTQSLGLQADVFHSQIMALFDPSETRFSQNF